MLALSRPRRTVATLALSVVALFAFAGSAAAAGPGPIRTTFDYTKVFTDGDVCAAEGLAIDAVEHVTGFVLDWYASDGTWLHASVVVDIQFEISADNGVTLLERDRLFQEFDEQGYRQVGLWEHVRGPNGIVVLDAGQLVFDRDGNVLFEPGRHDFFHELSSFCPGFLE